jgi:Flp pilus assembly protein TadD
MTSYKPALLLLSAAPLALALPVSAQMVQPVPGVTVPADPMSTLSVHLRTLAANPRNLFALLGAGQAALEVGDPNAALGFFARAEEIEPRNGRAKAGLASTLVQLEKPDDALRLFGEAMSLGVPETELAKDRGLAYDLRGDNRRAQRDYAMALRKGPDDEITRRYALSLGISGERSQALTVLDPLLRRQDQGAWRARAFILAMNNDVPGANAVARQVMPVSLAGSMAPFLARLPKLNPAERAHAVNFGTMPGDGQTFANVQVGDPYKPSGVMVASNNASPSSGLIPSGQPLGRSAAPLRSEPLPTPRPPVQIAAASPLPLTPAATVPKPKPPAPTPGFTMPLPTTARLDQRVGQRIGDVDPEKLPPELRGEAPRQVALLPRGTTLPPPDNVRIPATQSTPAPLTVAAAPVPPPAPSPKPEPVVVTAPKPEPQLAQVTFAPKPDAVVATPPASLPAAPIVTPAPSPPSSEPIKPPVQVAMAMPTPPPGAAPVPITPAPITTTSPLPPTPVVEPDAGLPASKPSPGFVGPPAENTNASGTAAPFEVATPRPEPVVVAAPQPEPAKPAETPAPTSRLASILSGIEPEAESAPVALPTATEIRAAQRAAARKAAAQAAAQAEADAAAQAEKDEKAKKAAAAKVNPARLWVQVATGSNERGLAATWRKIRDANTTALKPYGGYSVSFRSTNRVLAGPLRSAADARALVNALGKAGVSATTYNSEAGQEVVKLAAK